MLNAAGGGEWHALLPPTQEGALQGLTERKIYEEEKSMLFLQKLNIKCSFLMTELNIKCSFLMTDVTCYVVKVKVKDTVLNGGSVN